MKRRHGTTWVYGTLVLFACTAAAQPPEPGHDGGRPDPGRATMRPRYRPGDARPPGRWQPGNVLPPPVERQLALTPAQQQQLRALEGEVRDRLLRMLTPEQRAQLDRSKRRGPPGDPPGPPPNEEDPSARRSTPPDDGAPQTGGRARPPEATATSARMTAGIQWFATGESGLREARRTGRPILLVAGAPSCAGVPGVW